MTKTFSGERELDQFLENQKNMELATWNKPRSEAQLRAFADRLLGSAQGFDTELI